jgi:hypothetical protein
MMFADEQESHNLSRLTSLECFCQKHQGALALFGR